MSLLAAGMPALTASVALRAAWPAWAALLAGAGVVVLVWWTYAAVLRRSRLMVGLAVLRAAAALLLLAVLLRPTLLLSWGSQQRPVLIVGLDTSASMARADVPAGEGADGPQTRLAAVVDRLSDEQGRLLSQLVRRYDLRLVALAAGAEARTDITKVEQAPQAVAWLRDLKPDGARTDLAAAVRQVLSDVAPDEPLAGVVLISDGRRNAGAPLESTTGLLAGLDAPAVAVIAGSDRPLPDLRIARVEAPPRAFVDEPVVVRGLVEKDGIAGQVAATVQLIDQADDRVLAQQGVSLDAPAPPADAAAVEPSAAGQAAPGAFSLVFRPEQPGPHRLVVRVRSDVDEPDLRNNESRVQVEAVEAAIRVLHVDGYPRYEYRYLKNLLLREPRIVSSSLLLSADPAFPQEGDEPIARFPRTLDELDRYDVVLLGDVDPGAGWIDPQALENLAEWVRQRGGGLGFLAGSRNGPAVWRDTPLAGLLPVRFAEGRSEPAPAGAYRPELAPEGRHSPILLGAGDLDERALSQMPEWYWAAIVGPARPAAQTLLAHATLRTADGPVPLLVAGHYGAGRTLYLGTDEWWRWRRYDEDAYYKPFWLQAVRWLASPRKLGAYRRVVLEPTPAPAPLGEPVRVQLRVNDAQLAGQLSDQVRVDLLDERGRPAGEAWLQRTADAAAFDGSLMPGRAGTYTLQVDLPGLESPATAPLTVTLPLAESADVPADAAALRGWVQAVEAAGGQGHVLHVTQLEQLASLPLPGPRPRTQVAEIRLWDNGIALLVVAGLFLTEWALRRARGLA